MNKPNRVRQALQVFFGGILMTIGIIGFGCDEPNPALGTLCGDNVVPSLIVIALGSWFVLAVFVVLMSRSRANR